MKRLLSVLVFVALSGAFAFAGGSHEATAAQGQVKTLKVFINDTWYPTKTFTGIIPDEITKETGVKLDPTVAVDDQQLGVMIASGSLPDLVYTPGLLDRMSNANVSYDYDSLISKYKVDWNISPLQRQRAVLLERRQALYRVEPLRDDGRLAEGDVRCADRSFAVLAQRPAGPVGQSHAH